MNDLWIFVTALIAVYLVPGPDMVLLLQTGATQGRAHAMTTAAGLAGARAAHVALAGLGLAALFRTAPWTFDAVRYIGAAYLVWIGIGLLRASSLVPSEAAKLGSGMPQSYAASFRKGLFTNLLNPKALLFCSVLLPQFVSLEEGHVLGQFLLLGTLLVMVGVAFDAAYALLGASVSRYVTHNPTADKVQRGLFGTLLIGFGLRLALAAQM